MNPCPVQRPYVFAGRPTRAHVDPLIHVAAAFVSVYITVYVHITLDHSYIVLHLSYYIVSY